MVRMYPSYNKLFTYTLQAVDLYLDDRKQLLKLARSSSS